MPLARWYIVVLCFALTGCHPGSERTVDEQREPYFLAGKKRAQDRDFSGAIEYFEKALDVNPRSASAHFELGILYEQLQSDYSAALYHYQRAVTIRPDHTAADIIKQHIEQCKRELAKSVVQLPSMEAMQRKIDTLTEENRVLRHSLQAWENYHTGRSNNVSSSSVPVDSTPAIRPLPQATPRVETTSTPPSSPVRSVAPRASTTRVHTVASGETLGLIARRYGVKVSSLQSANPSVDERKLRPGQTLVIPAPSP